MDPVADLYEEMPLVRINKLTRTDRGNSKDQVRYFVFCIGG